jgi:ABC-type spermidine/putrescine transport system permease subunit I
MTTEAIHIRSRSQSLYSPGLTLGLLTPLIVLLLITFVVPMIQVIVTSLTGGAYPGEIYVDLMGDQLLWTTIGRTLLIAGAVAASCLLIGYPLAAFIASARGGWQIALLALVVVPMWSSVIARTFAWFGMFRPNGFVTSLLAGIGLTDVDLLFTPTAVVIGMANVMLPILVLPVFATLIRYDESLSLAAATLGAGPVRTFFQVKLPVLAPQLITAAAAVFVLALGFFISPALLGGPQSSMLSNLIYQQVRDRFDFARADAIAVVLLVVTLLIGALLIMLTRVLRRR